MLRVCESRFIDKVGEEGERIRWCDMYTHSKQLHSPIRYTKWTTKHWVHSSGNTNKLNQMKDIFVCLSCWNGTPEDASDIIHTNSVFATICEQSMSVFSMYFFLFQCISRSINARLHNFLLLCGGMRVTLNFMSHFYPQGSLYSILHGRWYKQPNGSRNELKKPPKGFSFPTKVYKS